MSATCLVARLTDALKDVEDPELPISVVDLGLLVDLTVEQGRVHVDLTFTAMGCPAMDMIMDDVRSRLLQEPEVTEVEIDVVWHPVWTKDRLSSEGRACLREWGVSV